MRDNIRLTSEVYWTSALVVVLIDVGFVSLLARRVEAARFRQVRWTLVVTAAIAWGIFAIVLWQVFWDIYYRYFLPNTSILLVTPLVGALLALVFHWLALRLPGNPIVSFCLLGGLESLLEHLWGIYGLGILRAPLMQAVAPLSILAFAVPEYIFYWCVVLSIAVLLQSVYRRLIA